MKKNTSKLILAGLIGVSLISVGSLATVINTTESSTLIKNKISSEFQRNTNSDLTPTSQLTWNANSPTEPEPTPPIDKSLTLYVDAVKFKKAFGHLKSNFEIVDEFNKLTFLERITFLVIRNSSQENMDPSQVLKEVSLVQIAKKLEIRFTPSEGYEIINKSGASLDPDNPLPLPEIPEEPKPIPPPPPPSAIEKIFSDKTNLILICSGIGVFLILIVIVTIAIKIFKRTKIK